MIEAGTSLAKVPFCWAPTLAIDATSDDPKRKVHCALNARAFKRMVGGRLQSTAAPRLFLVREPLSGVWKNVTYFGSAPLTSNDEIDYTTLIDKLASYRAHNYNSFTRDIDASRSASSLFASPARFNECHAAAPTFSFAIEDHESRKWSDQTKEDALVEAFFDLAHRENHINIRQLANLTTANLRACGWVASVDSKYVAKFLRRLFLIPKKVGVGLVLEIDETALERVHTLYWIMDGVSKHEDCDHCRTRPSTSSPVRSSDVVTQ
jgi:hypothetical protein